MYPIRFLIAAICAGIFVTTAIAASNGSFKHKPFGPDAVKVRMQETLGKFGFGTGGR